MKSTTDDKQERNQVTMKQLILAMAACAVIGAANSEDAEAAKRAKAREEFERRTGGQVTRPGTQKGEVVYVNCQSQADRAWIEESVAYFAKETRFKVTLRDGGAFDLKAPKVMGNATLFVIDDATLPILLVAPDSRWAAVNIAPIAEERRPAFFAARVKKMLTRGFAFLCGATNSQFPRSLTRGLATEADLDRNPDLSLPIDVLQRFRTYMEPLGVQPAVVTTYRKACQQGWAPPPTNEFQKAIWEKVHAIPDLPIKIEFDPKKDK